MNLYEQAQQIAEQGDKEQAYELLIRHLENEPEDNKAMNDLGVILYCLGRSDEAVSYLEKAIQSSPDPAQVAWNLLEVYLDLNRAEDAAKILPLMDKHKLLNPDITNRVASIFIEQNNSAGALEILFMSLKKWPNQKDIISPVLEKLKNRRAKVAFFIGGDGPTFVKDIFDFVSERFETRLFDGQTVDQMHELMQWSDIAWFEWCSGLAVQASKLTKVCKTIVRIHRYEAYTDFPAQMNWENIDVLVNIGNDYVKNELAKRVLDIDKKTCVIDIPNAIDVEKFAFINQSKGKNLAFVGNINSKKNPAYLIHCFNALVQKDSEYKLYFAGQVQDPVVMQYLEYMVQELNLQQNVYFDGFQKDITAWLNGKHYIVNSSFVEGHPVGLMESMSCGLKPILHNYPGAKQFFSEQFIYNGPEEFVSKILSDDYQPEMYRRFVEKSYPLWKQQIQVLSVFNELEAQLDQEKSGIVYQDFEEDTFSSVNLYVAPDVKSESFNGQSDDIEISNSEFSGESVNEIARKALEMINGKSC